MTSEDEDPAKDDASMVVASLAQSLIPCASEASRDASIAAVADIVLAPDAMFSTDASRDARCDLATALVEQLDKATLEPLAKGLVGALVEPCLRGAPQDGREKARFLGGARAASYILRTCASGGSSRRPTKLQDRADDVHESVHSAARLALNAFDRLFLRDDEALRKQGADLLNSVLPSLRMAPDAVDDTSERLPLLDFVAKAA